MSRKTLITELRNFNSGIHKTNFRFEVQYYEDNILIYTSKHQTSEAAFNHALWFETYQNIEEEAYAREMADAIGI